MPFNKDTRKERGDARPADTRGASSSDARLRQPSPLPPGLQRAMRWVMLVGWVVPTVLLPLIALFAPLDVLDRWPELTKTCATVKAMLGQLFPTVDFFRHARSTMFPQVATVATAYTAIAWVWMTGVTLLLTFVVHAGVRPLIRDMGIKKLLWAFWGFPPFALGGLFVFFALPGDPSFASGLTTSSRGGYAFMGTSILLIGSIGLGMWPIVTFTLLFDTIFRSHRYG